MKQQNLDPNRVRNPKTFKRHREEVLLQITVPLIAALAVVLLIGGLSVSMSSGETSRWADISLIWLIVPLMVLSFFTLITLIGTIYGLYKLIQALPVYSYQLQIALLRVQTLLSKLSDRSVEPALRLSALTASTKRLFRLPTRQGLTDTNMRNVSGENQAIPSTNTSDQAEGHV